MHGSKTMTAGNNLEEYDQENVQVDSTSVFLEFNDGSIDRSVIVNKYAELST